MSQLVEFHIAGRHEIVTPSGRVLTPRSHQLFALLLCCGLSPEFRMATQRLRDMLWDTIALRNRAHALRQLVFRARRLGVRIAIRDGLVQLDAAQIRPHFVLTRDPAQLREEALAPHDTISGELCAAWAPQSRALDAWLEQERRRYAADLRVHLTPLVEREYQLGNHAVTERLAQRLCDADPLNPHAQFRYAQAVAIRGDMHGASDRLAHFVREHAPARSETGAQLLRLHEQLRRTTDSAAPPGAVFVRAGCEPILQRLDGCLAAVSRGEAHVVRLLGAPGSGKSTLAVEVGRRATVLGCRSILLETHPEQVAVSSVAMTVPKAAHRTLLQRLVHRLLLSRGALGMPGATLDTLRAFAATTTTPSLSTPPSIRRGGRVTRAHTASHQSSVGMPAMEDVLALIACVTDEQPVVLCIDDWHAADREARTFCTVLCERLDAHAMLFLVTEQEDPHQQRDTTPQDVELRGVRCHSLTIPLLAPEQARRLAEQLIAMTGIPRTALPFPLFGNAVPTTPGQVVQWLQRFDAAPLSYSSSSEDSSDAPSMPPSYSRNFR